MENQNVLTQTNAFNMSKSYKVATSQNIVDTLVSKGFTLENTVVNRVKDQAKLGYQKHRLVFSNDNLLGKHSDGQLQLLVTNSYDGTSGVVFQLGFYRLVCSNGLVVGKTIGSISLRHTGIELDKKIDSAIVEIAAQAKRLTTMIDKMKSIQLDNSQIVELNRKALGLRLELKDNQTLDNVSYPINRLADQGNDLFTVYNVIQEGLIRGNVKATITQKSLPQLNLEENKVVTLRAIKGISSTTKVNKELFDLVNEYIAA